MAQMNIEQQRAAYALAQVKKGVEGLDKDARKEWLSRANELPAMIQMNGIGATVAFYQMKATDAHKGLLKILSGWLCDKSGIYQEPDLIHAIVNGDMHTYRAAQAEAQAMLVWVKKFSKIHCREDYEPRQEGNKDGK